MIEELAKHDEKWRQLALMITGGNKSMADDLVNDMYLRRIENDRGQPITEYYIMLTMKSIYLNNIKTNRLIPCEELRPEHNEIEKFEINDSDKEILDRFSRLSFSEKELIELSYEFSLREIQKRYGINYGYAYRIITNARKKILQERISEYNNKRLKYKNMKSRGLGDTIEKITKAIGLKGLIDKMGIDCGCEDRKEYLNRIFEYKLKPRCLTSEEIEAYAEYYQTRKPDRWEHKESVFVVNLYNSVFGTMISGLCTTCSGTAKLLKDLTNRLDIVYANNIPKQVEEKKPGRKKAETKTE